MYKQGDKIIVEDQCGIVSFELIKEISLGGNIKLENSTLVKIDTVQGCNYPFSTIKPFTPENIQNVTHDIIDGKLSFNMNTINLLK